MTVGPGSVVRFKDRVDKKRPAVVVHIDEGAAVIIEGTSQGHWKDGGDTVLLEAGGGTRIANRMGLARHVTTYFYANRMRIHFVKVEELLVSKQREYTCADADLRRLQTWVFGALERPLPARDTTHREHGVESRAKRSDE